MKKRGIKDPEVWSARDRPKGVARIVRILESRGYAATKSQTTRLRLLSSADVGASWLTMPRGDDAVWEHITGQREDA